MSKKFLSASTFLVYTTAIITSALFLVFGTKDISNISEYLAKLIDVNITISIGYSALLAAISSFASNNTRQDHGIKHNFMSFIYITVFFVLANVVLVVVTFAMDQNYNPFWGRFLISWSVFIVIVYSHLLLRNMRKLMY